MKLIIVLVTITAMANVVSGDRDKFNPPTKPKPEVNQGASTSNRNALTPLEICDLDNHASTIVNVLFAEDSDAGTLQHLDRNELAALDGFYEYIRNIFMYAVHGPTFFYLPTAEELTENQIARTNYIIHKIIEKILGILYESCSDHFRNEMAYTFNSADRSLEFSNRLTISTSSRCLCPEGARSRRCSQSMLKNDLIDIHLPEFRFHQDIVQELPQNQEHEHVNGVEIQRYHIIPPALIVRFMNTWLNSDDISALDYHLNRPYHGCIRSVFQRFRHSMRKIMIHEIKRMYGLTDDQNYNFEAIATENFFYDVYERWTAQSRGGNVFRGPAERGPLNPNSGLFTNERYRAFESSVELITGEERFQALYELFEEMVDYTNSISLASLTERLVRGVKLFIKMLTTFENYEVSPYNPDQWENRELRDEEFMNMNERMRRRYRNQKFWAPKDLKKKRRRDVMINGANPMNCLSIEKLARRRFNEFIINSMQTMLLAQGKDPQHSSIWECNFAELYATFRSYDPKDEPSESFLDCVRHTSFDTFLYHYLSKMDAWRDCLYHNTTKPPQEWCQAWRRILLNSNVGYDMNWEDATNASMQYQQDRERLFMWLANELIITDKSVKHIIDNPFTTKHDRRMFKILTDSVCFFISITSQLGCPNDCQARLRRSLGSSRISNPLKIYEREWFRDRDGLFKCKCQRSKNAMKNHETWVNSTISWLKSLFYTQCSRTEAKDEPRCTDLRR